MGRRARAREREKYLEVAVIVTKHEAFVVEEERKNALLRAQRRVRVVSVMWQLNDSYMRLSLCRNGGGTGRRAPGGAATGACHVGDGVVTLQLRGCYMAVTRQ